MLRCGLGIVLDRGNVQDASLRTGSPDVRGNSRSRAHAAHPARRSGPQTAAGSPGRRCRGGRNDVREIAETLRLNELALPRAVTVACQGRCRANPVRTPGSISATGSSALHTGHVGDTNMSNVARSSGRGAPRVRERPSRSRTAILRRGLADLEALGEHEGAGGCDTLVQNTELTHHRQQSDAKRDDHEPQHRIGDGECRHRALPLIRSDLGRVSPSKWSTATYSAAIAASTADDGQRVRDVEAGAQSMATRPGRAMECEERDCAKPSTPAIERRPADGAAAAVQFASAAGEVQRPARLRRRPAFPWPPPSAPRRLNSHGRASRNRKFKAGNQPGRPDVPIPSGSTR